MRGGVAWAALAAAAAALPLVTANTYYLYLGASVAILVVVTTGLNVLGQQINPGQQITRQQALHAYTRGNAWYLNREDDLGSIEEGKFGDLVVLDRDYFTVSDAEMRRIRPILTVVDGKVVHDAGVLGRGPKDRDD